MKCASVSELVPLEVSMNTLVVQSTGRVLGDSQRDCNTFTVMARCLISVGDRCAINFPDHDDPDSYRHHRLYHGQEAEVVKIRRKSVDLKLLTGPAAGEISRDVRPTNLVFLGPYIKAP